MKQKKNDTIKKDDIKTQLEELVNRHNESNKQVEYHTEIVKRCLGAIEVLQSLIKEEEEDAEVRKKE